jgi:hypothetical protein
VRVPRVEVGLRDLLLSGRAFGDRIGHGGPSLPEQ